VELRELLKEVVQELTPLANEKNLSLTLDLQENVNTKVQGDRLELHRVFTNLIGNAIKFTDKGSIDIRVGATTPALKSAESWVIVEVQDTGSGIVPEDQALLFERFRQGSHKRSGSGLGLHLSQRIVETHQGKIEVKSELGKGSLFVIYLPAQ
jgi:signal transduction histidine kinase